MSTLSGWSNLESFLTCTTPMVPVSCPFSSLISAFKLPCTFGVEVQMTEDEIVYFQPTLSAVVLPGFSHYELRPPHCRPSVYKLLSELIPESEIDEKSWMALLWIPINKLPPGRAYGSVLVYYRLLADSNGYLPVVGMVSFKIPQKWVNVYNSQGNVDYQSTEHWEQLRIKLVKQAHEFQNGLDCLHHDFNFIVCRDKSNLIR